MGCCAGLGIAIATPDPFADHDQSGAETQRGNDPRKWGQKAIFDPVLH